MGMPLELNTILKLSPNRGYPSSITVGNVYVAIKQDYRLYPINIPISLVNKSWEAYADVIIFRLTWEEQKLPSYLRLLRYTKNHCYINIK